MVFEVREGAAVHKDVGYFHVVGGNHNNVIVLTFEGVVGCCEYGMTEIESMCVQMVIIRGNPRLTLIDINELYFSLEVDGDNPIAELLK